MAETVTTAASESINENKFLTFHLAEELYGLDILKVREIIGFQEVTKVPGSEAYITGVINLRGKVIPVADLRLRFSLPTREPDNRTCIIVVEIAGESGPVAMGVVVDAVDAVINLPQGQIEKNPAFSSSVDQDCVKGLGKIDKQVVILLDIDQVCRPTELSELAAES